MSDVSEELAGVVDEAEWQWLEPHALRDGVILVAPTLELVEVGRAVAGDHAERIRTWLAQGLIGKPTPEQLRRWKLSPQRRFFSLIVQPYVLIQDPPEPAFH